MEKCIVTIARQYGSGGREIGQILAERTGLKFYDKDLITMAAQKSGLSKEVLDSADEKAANSLLYTLALGSSMYPLGAEALHVPLNDKLFNVQSEIIKEIALRKEGAIIVGRCSDYVLADYPKLLRVFIAADFDYRVKNIMDKHSLKESQAKDLIVKTDKRRANYYNYYTGGKWAKVDNYDLIISTDKIGTEGSVKLIQTYMDML
ncbi:MAG: cytidylate kinase-like family protein [Ruminococcaceae bacterium]|nr:cytidylate kinase-like family protein [Oscillospiraceae bacterium]